MVGKYVTLADSYVSVNEALKHATASINSSVSIDWIDSETLNGNIKKLSEVPRNFSSWWIWDTWF